MWTTLLNMFSLLFLTGTPQEASGGRLPRRRWSRRTGNDGVLMVKSMLDLRLLDSYGPDGQEEQQAEQEVRI